MAVGFFLVGVAGAAYGAGTPAEAKAMVEKAVAYYKANGKEKAFGQVNDQKGQFTKGDLYIFVYDTNGKCVAHGFNRALIGKDLKEMRDPDGTFYVKERIALVKAKGKGWQDYKFTNPESKKIERKTAYVELVDDLIFGCGAYKQ